MHAVVFQVDLKPDSEGSVEAELDQLVRFAKSTPGFVRGTWTTDGSRGLSFILFESEATARAAAAHVDIPPDSSATLRSVDVYEVVRDV